MLSHSQQDLHNEKGYYLPSNVKENWNLSSRCEVKTLRTDILKCMTNSNFILKH